MLLCALAWPGAASGQVVINEVLYDPDGPDTGLEFVELLNCGRDGVLLTDWVLETGNGASPDDWTVEWIGGALDYLEPGEILVIGESDVEPPPDYVTPIDLQNGPDGVRLTDGSGPVDVVGWGEPLFQEYYEGAPAADVTSGRSLGRSPDCYDTDWNAVDFVPSEPTPGRRNALSYDLSLRVRHAGATVFGVEEDVSLECVVKNIGALPAGGGAAEIDMLLDGGNDPACGAVIQVVLEPRDSTTVTLNWPHPTVGYHRADVRLAYPGDQNPSNNMAPTTFVVGSVGNLVALNEIMHSPNEDQTEWLELLNVAGDTADVSDWALGDGVERHPVVSAGQDAPMRIAPGDFLIVARDAEPLEWLASCPVAETAGWEALSSDDTVVLSDRYGTPIDMVTYERSWGGERGTSLERVRPDMPAQDVGNWGSSVAPEGSTPGRTNSIHLSGVPSPGRLTITPNPFTPDGDGSNDRCMVRFELPVARATVRLTVFDVVGRVRAVLMDHAAVASEGELLWDGTGADGEPLPTGLYITYLEAIDARAGVFVSAKTAVGIVR
jgi:hypothetical protein